MRSVDPALPGSDLIEQGLADLRQSKETVEALLVSIGAPRLERLGFALPAVLPNPEHHLYRLLERLHDNAAHSKYNALIRRLVSFERAAECAR